MTLRVNLISNRKHIIPGNLLPAPQPQPLKPAATQASAAQWCKKSKQSIYNLHSLLQPTSY
jgi:hypothetical protein